MRPGNVGALYWWSEEGRGGNCHLSGLVLDFRRLSKRKKPFEDKPRISSWALPATKQCLLRGYPVRRIVRKEWKHRGTILVKDSSSSSPGPENIPDRQIPDSERKADVLDGAGAQRRCFLEPLELAAAGKPR